MDHLAESALHSFIVKLWLDDQNGKKGVWRGYITHVPSGAHRYLKRLSDIDDFIKEYLDGSEMEGGTGSRVCDWFKRVTAKPSRDE